MKPHVTVHMITSVDGRIKTSRWSSFEGRGEYEKVARPARGRRLDVRPGDDERLCQGRIPYPATTDAPAPHRPYRPARCRDLRGGARRLGQARLGSATPSTPITSSWCCRRTCRTSISPGCGGTASPTCSAGRGGIDFARVLETLNREFGIRRLLVEGGGRINGSLLKAGLVDELSLLLAPAVDGLAGGARAVRLRRGGRRRDRRRALRLSLAVVPAARGRRDVAALQGRAGLGAARSHTRPSPPPSWRASSRPPTPAVPRRARPVQNGATWVPGRSQAMTAEG